MARSHNLIFAQNLRRECERYGSIAEVCRGIGVNRQQFAKYLSGTHIPSARTLKRLCRFLKIPEEMLFANRGYIPAAKKVTPDAGQRFWSEDKLLAMASAISIIFPEGTHVTPGSIPDGYYYCYLPMQERREMLVRAALHVKTRKNLTTFVRQTYFMTPDYGVGFVTGGRHRGLVISWGSEVYLLGVNSFEPLHFSLMTFQRVKQLGSIEGGNQSPVYVGLALTRGMSEPYSCRVCLEYIGKTFKEARDKLLHVGVVRFSESTVNSYVKNCLSPTLGDQSSQLGLPIFEHLLAAAAAASAKPAVRRR